MAVSAILNFGKFSSFDLYDIDGRVIPLYKVFPGWMDIFWIRCQSEGQIRGQRSNLLVQPLAFLRIQDACIYKGNKTYVN